MFPLIQVTYLTATGQTLDLITKPGDNFENFTLDRYSSISRYFVQILEFLNPNAADINSSMSFYHSFTINSGTCILW